MPKVLSYLEAQDCIFIFICMNPHCHMFDYWKVTYNMWHVATPMDPNVLVDGTWSPKSYPKSLSQKVLATILGGAVPAIIGGFLRWGYPQLSSIFSDSPWNRASSELGEPPWRAGHPQLDKPSQEPPRSQHVEPITLAMLISFPPQLHPQVHAGSFHWVASNLL